MTACAICGRGWERGHRGRRSAPHVTLYLRWNGMGVDGYHRLIAICGECWRSVAEDVRDRGGDLGRALWLIAGKAVSA